MIEDRIAELITPSLEEHNYMLVKVRVQSLEKRKALQIFAEKGDYKSLDISDCQQITSLISEILEEENVINGEYNLEVSSPGLERPLNGAKDFKRFEGFLISLKSRIAVDGVRKFKGRINLEGEGFSLLNEKGEKLLNIDFLDVESAKVVVTDELLKSKGKLN